MSYGRLAKGIDVPETRGAEAAKTLSSELGIGVDLHIRPFSATFEDDHCVAAPTYRVRERRVTGAEELGTRETSAQNALASATEAALNLQMR